MMRGSTPFSSFEELFERMNRQFDEMSRRFEESGAGTSTRGISVDVADRGEEVVVTADLPGFETENIDLSVADRTLTISAERETSAEEGDDESYLRRERRHESVRRTVYLPETVDEEGASAAYRNGILTVTMPKRALSEDSRRIDID